MDQPRRVCALAASPTLTYTYSGVEIRPEPWQTYPALLRVKERVERALGGGASFNSVLCNLYRDGRDYMGYHADDEPELRPSTAGKTAADAHVTIASVSFGAERRFLLRAKDSHATKLGKAVVEFKLAPGTLLVMGGNTQTYWKHSIPKMLAVKQARVNLTFRTIYPRVR